MQYMNIWEFNKHFASMTFEFQDNLSKNWIFAFYFVIEPSLIRIGELLFHN